MNERIKTLCKEAFTEAHESRIGPDGLVRSDGNPYIFYEKFAELIVRECADIAPMNQFQWDSAGEYVLKHFGIKDN